VFHRSPDPFARAVTDLHQSIFSVLRCRGVPRLSPLAPFGCEIALLRLSPAAAAWRVVWVVDRAQVAFHFALATWDTGCDGDVSIPSARFDDWDVTTWVAVHIGRRGTEHCHIP
jgi:hypothetical protein